MIDEVVVLSGVEVVCVVVVELGKCVLELLVSLEYSAEFARSM